MVRKIIGLLLCITLMCGFATQAYAVTHNVYESGAISTTYLTYYKDIVSGIGFNDNYVAFRDGQNSYIMVVGELECNGNTISLKDKGTAYKFIQEGTNYNNQYRYYVDDINDFSVNTNNYIVYSDVGDYPQLVERGAKYEIITAYLIIIIGLCCLIGRIFRRSFR